MAVMPKACFDVMSPSPTWLMRTMRSEAHARLKHDALPTEISQDLEQEQDVGGNIDQQLADIVNKRRSTKLPKAKQKEKMD